MTIIQDNKFEYTEMGSGKTFVLLHGLFGTSDNFRSVGESLAKKYRVIIPRLPLYSLPLGNTNIKSLSIYLNEFIEYKQLSQVNLLGNSLGGHVALDYALFNSHKIESLVLTGSSGLYEKAFGFGMPKRGDKDFIRQRMQTTFYDTKMVTDDLVDACYNLVTDRNKLLRILYMAKSAIKYNLSKDLPKLKVKTCLIWGKQDKITPPDVAKEFNHLMPHSELYWIDNCGHAPMMERPQEFNHILQQWLKQKEI
jgi:pimeloyl-ACP methyl ester carboxylesterase